MALAQSFEAQAISWTISRFSKSFSALSVNRRSERDMPLQSRRAAPGEAEEYSP